MRLWSYLKLTVGQVALTALLIAGSAAAETSDRFTPAQPEPGTDIPAATIKFGMRPYADNTFYVIGMKKGWFQDVGIVGAPELSDRAFEEYLDKTADAGFKLQVLDDAKSLVLAKTGREDFVNPEGAPIVYTLRQAGWTNLVDIDDLIKHGPGGVDSPIEPLIGIVGIGGNSDYINSHQNTVLRFLSVVWRVIDATKKDASLYDLQAPYLNSMAGTSLDGKGVADTVAILHPFTTFDDNKQYYDDKASTTYYTNVWNAVIKNFEEHSIIPAGKVTADDVVWGGPIWRQLVDYRTKTDEILKKLAGATLTADKQKLVDQAKTFYADYDFLDAYRLALAASS
jgi:hypothetical protein